jgi:hypothetical protein
MRKWASGGKEDIRCNLLGTMRREGATFHGCVPTDTTLGTIVFFDYRDKRGAGKYIYMLNKYQTRPKRRNKEQPHPIHPIDMYIYIYFQPSRMCAKISLTNLVFDGSPAPTGARLGTGVGTTSLSAFWSRSMILHRSGDTLLQDSPLGQSSLCTLRRKEREVVGWQERRREGSVNNHHARFHEHDTRHMNLSRPPPQECGRHTRLTGNSR